MVSAEEYNFLPLKAWQSAQLPLTFKGLFIYGNSYDDVYRFERHIVFPKILAQNCADFSTENTIYNANPTKAGTARRYFCNSLSPEVNSYTLETSIMGYVDPDTEEVVPYTEEAYCR